MSGYTFRVVGLDLSLTSSGMSDGVYHRAVQTHPGGQLEERMGAVVTRSMMFVRGDRLDAPYADLVVIEGGAFSRGAQSKGAEVLSALRFMVRYSLWDVRVPFAMVTPTGLKLYTSGTGTATKARMVQAVRERHDIDLSHIKVKDGRYDMADACALAAMGYARLGQPMPTEGPPPPRASLNAVAWPDNIDSIASKGHTS